jgi:steroid 5-alpha reductase family enzyme
MYIVLGLLFGIAAAAVATWIRYEMIVDIVTILGACLAAAMAFQSIIYFVSRRLGRLDIVDIAWGPSFIVIALTTVLLGREQGPSGWLLWGITVMVSVWGARLAWHIGRRFLRSTSQDTRYTELSKQWRRPEVESFLKVFMLQAVLAVIVSIPVIYINAWGYDNASPWLYIGIMLWLFGLTYETIADYQLQQFLQLPSRPPLLTSGLRRFSRYPNYFGELCVWWGFALISFGAPHGWVGLIGALMISYLLLYVSGIPLAEKSAKKKSGWAAYARRTSLLVPLPPKTSHQ